MSSDNYYNRYIKKLKELHQDYPDLANEEAKFGLERLGVKIEEEKGDINTKLFGTVEIKKLCFIGMFVFIGLLGLTTLNQVNEDMPYIFLYYFGMIFFVAGFFVGNNIKGVGIIFLFSHGGTGFGLMLASLLGNTLKSPVFEDIIPLNIKIYLIVGICFIVLAFLVSIINNLSDKIRYKTKYPFVPLSIFTIVFVMAALFPYIIKYL